MARGALDEVARQAREGRSARRGGVADDPVALADLGTADIRLRAAGAGVREAVRDAHALAEQRRPVGRGRQAMICLAAQVASDIAVEATSTAHQIAGGAAAYRGDRVLRALDDVQAARQHLMLARLHRPALTRVLVGFDAPYPPFVV
jgi:alkylation response protein AidB-like acyl-CoA dehydrogenase